MWDDGLATDLKLIDILRKVGATAAFAISPSRHKKNRVENDVRGNYGTLVSACELQEFKDFEICNHGDMHLDLGSLDYKKTELEILNGKKKLEDIFEKEISGFCYSYGVCTFIAKQILSGKVKYARTTKNANGLRHPLELHPTSRWRNIEIEKTPDNSEIIFWGHTYEFETKSDWEKVKNTYEYIVKNPNMKIISFNEMINKICY